MTHAVPHLRLVPEPTATVPSDDELPLVYAWFDEDDDEIELELDEPTIPSMPALSSSNRAAPRVPVGVPNLDPTLDDGEDDWLELDELTEPVVYEERAPRVPEPEPEPVVDDTEPPVAAPAASAAPPAPPDPPPEPEAPPSVAREPVVAPVEPAPTAPIAAGASAQLVAVPVHLPMGTAQPITVTVSTQPAGTAPATQAPAPQATPELSAEEKALVFKLQVEVDVAHEGLLLWRSAVVLLALIALTLLRMYLIPGDVPWR